MSNARFRRTRRISDSKDAPKIRDLRKRRFSDADDEEEEEVEEKVEINGTELTKEEVQGLLELLPYKEALIKIAKGEFEIERVEEADEEGEEETAEEENFEEDEDFTEEGTDEGAGDGEGDEDFEDYEDYEDEDETEAVEDSAHLDAWKKRLAGNEN